MAFNILNGILNGGLTLLTTGNPVAAVANAVTSTVTPGTAGNGGNIAPNTDPTIAAQQQLDQAYEWAQLGLNAENMRHNLDMEWQSTLFNEAEDEKTEQMREMNTLRDVAMKQREADISILKEFIKTVKD
ncbi:MAG TPA: hypothetical protein VKG44_11620 [Candidatus Baltobacteraceae bacterium]|nr:hypothetical protein [Candidatus Baltobacteraceae bacterium]